ncbi:hypothetical protein Pcinc_029276 [Petrolisthes cinctipes]|uniref:TMC domain-containing protein n=1 Tax=Petrolisthes cinctipes TaxID=88211 RepID=A0AAE1K454_PETCI|nr:hypothetical protein Pcinc_029276 [Petrolisthes cinctipes]
MASRTYTVEVEGIPLDNFTNVDGSGSEGSGSSSLPLRRARTDFQLQERGSSDFTRCHTLSGWEHRLKYSLPLHHGGDLGGGRTLHHTCERRPSAWYNTVMARRRQGVTPASEEDAVEEIANAMKGDVKFMTDNVDGELMRRETLRELTKPLRVKKELRRKLTIHRSTQAQEAKGISPFKYLKYTISMHWYKLKQSVRDTFHDYSLWHKDLKEIEGTFGSGMGTYFRFLRYLLLLNFIMSVIVCGFLLTPQLLVPSNSSAPAEASFVVDDNDSLVTAAALRVSDDSPSSNLDRPHTSSTSDFPLSASQGTQGTTFGAFDWLTGAGWFDTTALYYGTYNDESMSLIEGVYYNIPEAYFLVILISYIFYIIVIIRRVTILYKSNYVDTEHDVSTSFVKKVFSSWDFSITETKAAIIKHRSIYSELKELLEEYLREEEEVGRWERVRRWCIKLVFWLLVLGLLGVLGWATYLMLDNAISKDIVKNTESSGLGLMVYPLIVTCIITVVPPILALMVKLEPYKSPRHRLIVTLVRTFLLEVSVLGILVAFWFLQATDHNALNFITTESTTIAPTTISSVLDDDSLQTDEIQEEKNDCWETSLGQEFYRLLIIDFFLSLIIHLGTLIFSIATRKSTLCSNEEGRGKLNQYVLGFDMSCNTLRLIYNQTLLWAGLFFCPLTPLIVLIKMFITFYIQKFMVLKFLRPDERPWRAAQTETVFFALTLLSLLLAFFGYGFIIVRGNTSSACGPFRTYTHYIEFMWDLTASDQQTILQIFSFFAKPGVVTIILGILMILVYCAKSMAEGRAEMIKVLRQQLKLEMRDRAFLLQITENVRSGEHRLANPGQAWGAAARKVSSPTQQNLPQRAASFVFTDNKVHPADVHPQPRYFSDDTEESQI